MESFNNQFDWRYDYKFEEVHLLRNEKQLTIYDNNGRGFQPDFILFCKERDSNLVRQVFIEPKGAFLHPIDEWKNIFLSEIQKKGRILECESAQILICAASFFNYSEERKFRKELENILQLPSEKEAKTNKLKKILFEKYGFSEEKPDKKRLIDELDRRIKLDSSMENNWDHGVDTGARETTEVADYETPVVNWDGLSVDELKEYLRAIGLPVGGKKAELISRLEQAENPTQTPQWGEMKASEIKRYLRVFPPLKSAFYSYLGQE